MAARLKQGAFARLPVIFAIPDQVVREVFFKARASRSESFVLYLSHGQDLLSLTPLIQ